MKFRYYITDLYQGEILGTDSSETAENCSTCEDYFVVDSETGKWLTPFEPVEIQECPEINETEIPSK